VFASLLSRLDTVPSVDAPADETDDDVGAAGPLAIAMDMADADAAPDSSGGKQAPAVPLAAD
jgi:hypothetical protein